MNLTELRYLVAVDRERHFRRAAESCFVSQPSLSQGIKNLEQELGVQLFERGNEVITTDIGNQLVLEARQVLQRIEKIKQIARTAKDPLNGVLKVGLIYSIAPYVLPGLIRQLMLKAPHMPLRVQENFTHRLVAWVLNGQIDVAVMAAPFPPELNHIPIYEEPFVIAVPLNHPWAQRSEVDKDELIDQTLLLLGEGHCFRDNVLEICPEQRRAELAFNSDETVEGVSLETIRHTVASGYGITILPASAQYSGNYPLHYIRLAAPEPSRRVGVVWRKNFARKEAVHTLCEALGSCLGHSIRLFQA